MNLRSGLRPRRLLVIGAVLTSFLLVTGVGWAANASSTFNFAFSPGTAPKTTFKAGSLLTNLVTGYVEPGNDHPGGAVERTQIYLDKNFKINPKAVPTCPASKLAGKTMSQAISTCGKSLVGTGTATANANGAFIVNGCVLLFNGPLQAGLPTLNVFDRVQIANPSHITCGNPSTNNQGNGTVLLKGTLRDATAPYGQVLDVNHITQSAAFPLEIFKTTIKKGNYVSARCAASDHLWHMKVTWTYNDNTKKTVNKTQSCTVG
jgi:hypothetical protein